MWQWSITGLVCDSLLWKRRSGSQGSHCESLWWYPHEKLMDLKFYSFNSLFFLGNFLLSPDKYVITIPSRENNFIILYKISTEALHRFSVSLQASFPVHTALVVRPIYKYTFVDSLYFNFAEYVFLLCHLVCIHTFSKKNGLETSYGDFFIPVCKTVFLIFDIW